jgi:hypothetical protein
MDKNERRIKLQNERISGEDARQIIENPLVVQTIEDMKSATIEKWRDAATEADRTDLWQFYRAVCLFEQAFVVAMENGRFATSELDGLMQEMRRVV